RRASRIDFWASAGMVLSVAIVAICLACSNWPIVTTGIIGLEREGATADAVGGIAALAAVGGGGTCGVIKTSAETTNDCIKDGAGACLSGARSASKDWRAAEPPAALA